MITQEFSSFFTGLIKNNNKAWFDEHRKDYEKHVKKPFIALVDRLIPQLAAIEPAISMNAKDALFRINRDIRFSADKTPYNILMKAGLSPGGKKSFLPGYYLGIGADSLHMGGGLFNVKPPEVKSVRDLIVDEMDDFNAIVRNKGFKSAFGELNGEKAKRLDKRHQEVLKQCPEIANKQFFAMTEVPLKDWLGKEEIDQEIMKYFAEISKLNKFLNHAF